MDWWDGVGWTYHINMVVGKEVIPWGHIGDYLAIIETPHTHAHTYMHYHYKTLMSSLL